MQWFYFVKICVIIVHIPEFFTTFESVAVTCGEHNTKPRKNLCNCINDEEGIVYRILCTSFRVCIEKDFKRSLYKENIKYSFL